MKKLLFSIHPLLFAMFFILALYSFNAAELCLSSLWIPLVASFGFALVLLLLALLFIGLILKLQTPPELSLPCRIWDLKKAAIVASISVVLFFTYGYALDIVKGWGIGNFHIGDLLVGTPERYLLLIWAVLGLVGAYLTSRIKWDLHNLTIILTVVAVTLVLVPSISIGTYELKRPAFTPKGETTIILTDLEETDALPDIYYIILDGYASSSTLKEIFNYNNHEFTDYLTEKGFYVAYGSVCNYRETFQSLSSSLNMEYINYLSDVVGPESKDPTVLYQMTSDSKVMNFVRSKGYHFINFGSGTGPTNYNEYADLNVLSGTMTEFSTLLIQSTMLRLFLRDIIVGDARDRVLGTFSKLAEMPEIEGPKFVFAHIMCPHPPYVFGADGEPVEGWILEPNLSNLWDKDKYLNQLIFLNTKVEILVDEILSNAETSPVIVLQADHGPASGWPGPITEELIRERMGILNAYYLPGGGNDLLYEDISPVNTFRVIFNFYFNAKYELLSDYSYFSALDNPYKFIDVTDEVGYD